MIEGMKYVGLALGLVGAVACNGSETTRQAATESSQAPMTAAATPPPPPARVMPAVETVVPPNVRCQARRVFFATDSAALSDESRRDLTNYARCLTSTSPNEDVVLRGRADPRGTEPYNLTLSEQRAEAVATFLQSQGVTADRIRVRALGEEGMTEGMPELWPTQRRVNIVPVEANGQAAPAMSSSSGGTPTN